MAGTCAGPDGDRDENDLTWNASHSLAVSMLTEAPFHDPETTIGRVPALLPKGQSKTGKRRNLGTFKSRAAAEKHERDVQYFKRH